MIPADLGEGRYRIESEIGRGGMATVVLARDLKYDRPVAIKLLSREVSAVVAADRFISEIQIAAGLTHPNILPVHDSGVSDGWLFYVMPFIDGPTLRAYMRERRQIPTGEALRIIREVADALDFAHRRGVLHRDVKPENVLLADRHAVLADFGVARALTASGTTARLTATGGLLGTPLYMSPEQAAGARALDGRSDQYSLACMLYEMLTGKPPFGGPALQAVIAGHLVRPAPSVRSARPDVPRTVEAALLRAMAKTPEERFDSVAEFAAAMDDRSAKPSSARRAMGTGRTAARARKVGWMPRALVAMGGLAVAIGVADRLFVDRSAGPLDSDLLAVVPFAVYDLESTWREGLVDILSRNLDHQGPIRTVSPSLLLRHWSGRSDRASAAQLGQRMQAGLVLYGSVYGLSGDSILLDATVLDVTRDRAVGGSNVQVRGARDDLVATTQSFSFAVLNQLRTERRIGAFRQTALGTRAIPALQSFLVGEQLYRRSSWDSAVAFYEHALAEDSSFALAASRLGQVMRWRRGGDDEKAKEHLLRAGRFNSGLSRRDSMLIHSDSLRAVLISFENDTAYLSRTRRLIQLLRSAQREYPDDPEIAYALADALFHHASGPGVGVSESELMEAFDRALALDSAFAPAFIHPIEVGFSLGGQPMAQPYIDRYLALAPTDSEAEAVLAILDVLRQHAAGRRPASVSGLDTLSADATYKAWRTLRRWPETTGIALLFAEALQSPRHHAGVSFGSAATYRLYLALQLAYRGRFSDALAYAGDRSAGLFSEIAFLGGVPEDAARGRFDELLDDAARVPPAAVAWWMERGDTAALRTLRSRTDSLADETTNAAVARNLRYRSLSAAAHYALAAGDTTTAIERFRVLPDTLCFGCYLDRLVLARLLIARNDHEGVRDLLDERLHAFLSPVEVFLALERGRFHEMQDRHDAAVADYLRVVNTWVDADPVLQPLVVEARRALERLQARTALTGWGGTPATGN